MLGMFKLCSNCVQSIFGVLYAGAAYKVRRRAVLRVWSQLGTRCTVVHALHAEASAILTTRTRAAAALKRWATVKYISNQDRDIMAPSPSKCANDFDLRCILHPSTPSAGCVQNFVCWVQKFGSWV